MHRWFRSLLAAVVMVAAVAGITVVVAAPAQALGAGEVCMFNAPSGADVGGVNFGHVGWAFRVGGSSTWEFGATESTTFNWRDSGSATDAQNTFRGLRGHSIAAHYYTQWKCANSASSSVTAASNEVNTLYSQGYNIANNNCLTRTIAIFKAYDGGSFGGLYNGDLEGPNNYFNNLPSNFNGPYYL